MVRPFVLFDLLIMYKCFFLSMRSHLRTVGQLKKLLYNNSNNHQNQLHIFIDSILDRKFACIDGIFEKKKFIFVLTVFPIRGNSHVLTVF